MNCDIARDALSSQLDGERPICAPEAMEEHLADCAECREWQEAAHVVTRRVRLSPAPVVRDRTEEILAAVLTDRADARTEVAASAPTRGRWFVRVGLVAAALGQFVIILPALTGHAGLGAPVHTSRELGAFNLALAVGFAAAAVRPVLARGAIPLVGTATAALLLVAVVDAVAGQTNLRAEAPHLIALAGWLLLHLMTRSAESDGDRGPAGTGRAGGTRLRLLGLVRRASGAGSPVTAGAAVSMRGFPGRASRSAHDGAEEPGPSRAIPWPPAASLPDHDGYERLARRALG